MTDLATIADTVDALTNPIGVREVIYDRQPNGYRKISRLWVHTLPSLLNQLAAAVIPGEAYVEDDGGHVHRKPSSIPPARLEAINACLIIEAGAATWAWRAGRQLRETAEGNLRAIVGAPMDSDMDKRALTDLRRWYGMAATVAGWERPAWRPDAPCPACETIALRVHLARKTATCVNCGESWTPDTIGILGDYVAGLRHTARHLTIAMSDS
jgi:hypothetical protein